MIRTNRSAVLIACLIGLLVGMALTLSLHSVQPTYAVDNTVAAKADRGTLLTIQNAFTSIASELKPTVVFITAERTVTTPDMPDIQQMFRDFPFGGQGFDIPIPRGGQKQQATASGSGIIVRSDGYIVTNDHVVAGADRVTVKLDDGREFVGKVMRDPRNDLAVVKIDATGLPTAKLGNSDQVKVGQWAIAIGSPFGLTNSLTVGVVSALARGTSVPDQDVPQGRRDYPDMIQTDASINPGNSGGPLVDINGEVIGINTMIESPTGTNAGIGFAVPSNTVDYVVDQLIKNNGKLTWGKLGTVIRDITPAVAKAVGTTKGALVDSVEAGSPADKAGIKPMDVILEVNGQKMDDYLMLRKTIERIKPGTKVPIVLLRDGKQITVQATIVNASEQVASSSAPQNSKLGLTVGELTDDMAQRLGLDSGIKGVMVKSVDVGSPASRAEPPIAPGDVITAVKFKGATTPTPTVAKFNSAIAGLKSGDTALIQIHRGDRDTISVLSID